MSVVPGYHDLASMGFGHIVQASLGAFAIWFVVESIRRLLFHPLSHVPGPRLAVLTWWYEFYYDQICGGRYVFKIQELHEIYGPIIRVTPDELHVADVGFLDTVYAPASSRRHKYDWQVRSLRLPGGVGLTTSHDLHKIRRDALLPFFSKRNVVLLQPVVDDKVEQLGVILRKHATNGTVVNLSDLFYAFSNDITNNFLFAHKTDLLVDKSEAAVKRQNSRELLHRLHVNRHLPWFPDFMEMLPISISKPLMPPGLLDLLQLFQTVKEELTAILDAKSKTGANSDGKYIGGKESVYDSVLDSKLPPAEKAFDRLEKEGSLLILAGTESPARALNVMAYYILSRPDVLRQLREEVDPLGPNLKWSQVEKLPYLNAVIEEGHRLSFGVNARMARIADDTLTYTPSEHVQHLPHASHTYAIPPGTPVSISSLSAHTTETVFPNPEKFEPERWLGEEGRKRRKFQFASLKGSRKCLGIELAGAELSLALVALVQTFDIELFQTDESDVASKHDYQIAWPDSGSKGLRATVKLREH